MPLLHLGWLLHLRLVFVTLRVMRLLHLALAFVTFRVVVTFMVVVTFRVVVTFSRRCYYILQRYKRGA